METLQNTDDRQWLRYIETLRQNSHPVKIDVLLEKRMQTFIAMRNAKLSDAVSCDS